MITTQKQIREMFWDAVEAGQFEGLNISRKKITDYSGKGKMYNTDTRCAFVDFVDSLSRDGELAEGLTDRVTL